MTIEWEILRMDLSQSEEHRLLAAMNHPPSDKVLVERELGADDVVQLLTTTSLPIAIEDYADAVTLISQDARWDLWKQQLKPLLVDLTNMHWTPDSHPGGKCYLVFLLRIDRADDRVIWCKTYH